MSIKYERKGSLTAVGARSGDLLDKSMNEWLKIDEDTPLHFLQFFRKSVPDTDNFKLATIGDELGFPRLRSDTDPVPYDTPPPGYSANWDLATYQNGIAATERLVMYDRSGQLAFIMGGLPKSFRRFYEYGMANTVETAAATTGADNVYGFHASHPHRGAGGGTWSNLETSAVMDSTSVNAMWVNMANRTNAFGFSTNLRMKKIFGPTKWREKMVQLVNSDKVPETNVNAVNAYKGMQYEVAETLTQSTTAWYGWGDLPEQQWGFHLIEWKAPTITGLPEDPNYPLIVRRYFGYCRVVFGMSIPYNMHYNAGV